MIKTFRRIRQKMITDYKFRKYIIYAVGEIILVVIGILIAIQINNWNESRKDFAKSKNYLSEILKDLKEDTISFNKAIKGISTTIDVEEWAIEKIHDQTSPIDSLWLSFGGFYYDYAINDRTFQKVQNDGDFKFVGFESVTDEINNYYTVIKKRVQDHTAWDKKEVTENQSYTRNLETYIEIDEHRMEMIGAGIHEKSFSIRQDSLEQLNLMVEFANSIKGRNHFKNNYVRHTRLRNQFQDVNRTAMDLMVKINKELVQAE